MNAVGHLEVSQRLHILGHELIDKGDLIPAGEMLWGAVNRILTAIATHHPHIGINGEHTRRGIIIHSLGREYPDPARLINGMNTVGTLHGHFYTSSLSAASVELSIRRTDEFIALLLNLPQTRAIT